MTTISLLIALTWTCKAHDYHHNIFEGKGASRYEARVAAMAACRAKAPRCRVSRCRRVP